MARIVWRCTECGYSGSRAVDIEHGTTTERARAARQALNDAYVDAQEHTRRGRIGHAIAVEIVR